MNSYLEARIRTVDIFEAMGTEIYLTFIEVKGEGEDTTQIAVFLFRRNVYIELDMQFILATKCIQNI